MDADVPYELAVRPGVSLVEIPIQWALDGWEQYIPDFSGGGLIESPRTAAEIWRLEFGELIAHVVSRDDVRVASVAEIAAYVRGLGLVPRSVPRPDL